MTGRHALDDPQIAAIAWRRFRRIMTWMALVGAICVALALALLHIWTGPMPIHMIIATMIGVWTTFMLGTGLMALVFLSAGTGHDEQVIDRMKDEAEHDA
jgi:peptidoglycan/LPS O-acetylase OafA/YrhL